MDKGAYLLTGMGAGALIGALAGLIVDNVGICLSMGIGFGAFLGAILSTFDKGKDDVEDESS